MALDFPDAPTMDQVFDAGHTIYKYNGTGWTVLSTQESFVKKIGDTMSGHLTVPTGPAAANAVRKDYVDNANATQDTTIAAKADTATVNSQDALRVLKSGDTMTGHLTISSGVLYLDAPQTKYLWWDGTGYNLGGAGYIWHQSNFNPASYQTVSGAWNTGNFNPASYLPLTGGSITGNMGINGQTGVFFAGDIAMYYRSNNNGLPISITVGRTTNECSLGVCGAANQYISGSNAGDTVLSATIYRMRFAAQSELVLSLAANGIGRSNAFKGEFTMNASNNGLCFRGGDASATSRYHLDFSDVNLTNCGVVNVNHSAHTTAYATSSDARYKPNRVKITAPEARSVIDQLEVYDFDKDGNEIRGYGVVAQQAYEVHKSLAIPPQDENDRWLIEKAAPVPFLIAALQGANRQIDLLEKRLKDIETKLADKETKMPPRSQQQRKAMHAAAKGKSTIGIPKGVAKEYVAADKGGKLPKRKGKPRRK